MRAQKQDPMKEMTKKALQKDSSLMEDPNEIKKASTVKETVRTKRAWNRDIKGSFKKKKIPLPPR